MVFRKSPRRRLLSHESSVRHRCKRLSIRLSRVESWCLQAFRFMAKTTPGALRDVCQSLTALSLMDAKEEDLRSRLLERCLNFCAAGRVLCNRDSVACPMLPRYSMARDVLVCAALGSKDH